MSSGRSLPPINFGVQGGIQGDSHSGAQRHIDSELRVESSFRVIPEQYFLGVENVAEFLENIDNNLTYYEIPTQLACAYLKGHLKGRTLDWFDVLGYKVVDEKATDYAQLKQALMEHFPRVRNRNGGRELLDHIISRLEPQRLDYVEVRHPQTMSSLLQNRQEKWRDTRVETRYHDISRPQRAPNRFGGQGVGDNSRFDSRRRSGQSDHRFINHGGRQGSSRNGAFQGQNGQDRISSLKMTPVDLPYVPILLNETFITALWDTGAEKSFISKEVYRRYFSYRPRQRTKDKDSRLTLDFDEKSLVIPDDQIKPLPIVEKPVEIDLSNTKLGERQKEELQDLFNSLKGLFSDKPGLTHVLYHEIDTGDQGPVVSGPYRYDRVKQGIIDYHI
ncbi:uncharacterized protein TNCV_3805041 [Trichonephila clavipes]|nr:uncharacterized protein TNCV_3805041 [Trichonephila clavipes]